MIEVPLDRISFTDQDIADDAARPELNLGWYRFLGRNPTLKVSKEGGANPGTFMASLQCAPLKDPEDQASATTPYVYHNLILPFVNPDVPGHKKPSARMAQPLISAVFDEEIPAMPQMVDGRLMFDGREIKASERDECTREVYKHVYIFAKKILADVSILENAAFYGEVVHDEKYGNGIFPFNISATLPAGKQLVHPDDFLVRPVVAAKTVAVSPARKGGKRK